MMLNLLQRKSLRIFHPLLKRLVEVYLKKPRKYSHKGITLTVYPSVFHPGLFYSTKFLISYLEKQELKDQHLLELGAGSGLISLFCAKKGALVTATDINEVALTALRENATRNQCSLNVISSDLFENVDPAEFDWIIVNPPYYPKQPTTDAQAAWYCGEDFEYFQRFFQQLSDATEKAKIIMVLSEDCDLDQIRSIAGKDNYALSLLEERVIGGELNYIFEIKRS